MNSVSESTFPSEADAQRDSGDRIHTIAGKGYGHLRAAVLSATSAGAYLPAAARNALVCQAVCHELADGDP